MDAIKTKKRLTKVFRQLSSFKIPEIVNKIRIRYDPVWAYSY